MALQASCVRMGTLEVMSNLDVEQQLQKMREDWDQRARENARHYVNTANTAWTDEEFFASGERTVAEEILTDMGNICQGKAPGEMRVLEIGCGAGRDQGAGQAFWRGARRGCQRRDGPAGYRSAARFS